MATTPSREPLAFTLHASLPQWRDLDGRYRRVEASRYLSRRTINVAEALVRSLAEGTPVVTGQAKAGWYVRIMGARGATSRIAVGNHMPYGLVLVLGHKAPFNIPNAFGFGPSFGTSGRFDGKFHPANKPIPALEAVFRTIPARMHVALDEATGDVLREMHGGSKGSG